MLVGFLGLTALVPLLTVPFLAGAAADGRPPPVDVYSNFAHVAGPALGGVLIAAIGLRGAYAVDVATFAASISAAYVLPAIPPTEKVAQAGLRTILDGLRYVRARRVLLGIFLVDTNAMIFGMPSALFPAFAEHLGGGPRTVGVLYAARKREPDPA